MDNLKTYKINEKTVYLLGTAHVSADSARQAEELIDEIKPDSVCIELDADRLKNMLNPKKWQDTDIADIIKQKRAAFFLANLILSSYQKRLADKFNISVGSEMLQSVKAAQRNGCEIVTADRDLKITFLRIWRKMKFWGKMKLLFNLIFSFVDDEEMTRGELEELKTQDMLQSALSELSSEFPDLKKYLVDERDMYLSYQIKNAPGKTVVAVVGAAHTIGLDKLFSENTEIDIDEISNLPPKSKGEKVFGWLIPALIVAMFAVTYFKDPNALASQLYKWVIYNGTFSALGTLIAGGHVLSALTAFVSAPITSLNPLLAAGWFAGLVQAKIVKPTVGDAQALSQDLSSLKGFRKNKLTKVLLVVVLGNIGSVIGTFAAGIGIFNIFLKVLGL